MPSLRAVTGTFLVAVCLSQSAISGPLQEEQSYLQSRESADDAKAIKNANRAAIIASIAHYDAKRQDSSASSPATVQITTAVTTSGATTVSPNMQTSPPTTTTTTTPSTSSPTTSPTTYTTPTSTSSTSTSTSISSSTSSQLTAISSTTTSTQPTTTSSSNTPIQPTSTFTPPSSTSSVPFTSAPPSAPSTTATVQPPSTPQTSFSVVPSTGFVPLPVTSSRNGLPVTSTSSVPVSSITQGPVISGTFSDVETMDQYGVPVTLSGPSSGKVYTVTDISGHVITTTYVPGGEPIRSIQVLTSTLPNGEPSTLTSVAVVVPTVVNGANQNGSGKPSGTAAAAASLVTGNLGVHSACLGREAIALVVGAGAVAALF